MKVETIEKILNFLKEKEGYEIPESWFDSVKKFELIKELENHPDGTQYKHRGNLNLINTNIKKLPNDLYVRGDLILNDCKQLTELPNELYVRGDLILNDCKQLRGLPDNLYFDGALDLRGCQYLTELPDNLYVKGSLGLDGTNITELPNNLYVGINLYINNTPLAKKYTNDEIREIIKIPMDDGIKGQIYR
jgi:hypothetical protein